MPFLQLLSAHQQKKKRRLQTSKEVNPSFQAMVLAMALDSAMVMVDSMDLMGLDYTGAFIVHFTVATVMAVDLATGEILKTLCNFYL